MDTFGLITTLMVAVIVLVRLADRMHILYPMLMVAGGWWLVAHGLGRALVCSYPVCVRETPVHHGRPPSS